MKNAGSHWELNPGPLTSATSALTTELRQPDKHQHFLEQDQEIQVAVQKQRSFDQN